MSEDLSIKKRNSFALEFLRENRKVRNQAFLVCVCFLFVIQQNKKAASES